MWDIPKIDYVVSKINQWYDSTEFVKNLYRYVKDNKWEEWLYKYFSEVYEELFSNLILKKTFISNSTKKMLETLATPIYEKSIEEKEKIYSKIEK